MDHLLRKLYVEWFENDHWWFQSPVDVDMYIRNTFWDLLDTCSEKDQVWTGSNVRHGLAWILAFDQLPHHIYRDQPAAHVIQYFLQKALMWSDRLAPFQDKMCTTHWIFWAMPQRHQGTLDSRLAWKRISHQEELLAGVQYGKPRDPVEERALMRRFMKAFYHPKRYSMDLHQQNTTQYTEYVPYDIAPFEQIITEPHLARDFTASGLQLLASESIIDQIKPLIKDSEEDIIVSVSGGVDSMLLLCALWAIAPTRLRAVHINYCNRSLEEERLVVMFCGALGVPLTVRRITEIQREPCMLAELRDMYESYTRHVRMMTYQMTGTCVFLGHNRDDCFENILTNVSAQQKYDNLTGMASITECREYGLTFVRPMLHLPKQNIRILANTYRIPHLCDSTPAWSQRGRIRDHVVPALKSWNPQVIDGLFHVSQSLQILMHGMRLYAQTILEKGTMTPCEWTNLATQTVFWRVLLTECRGIHVSQKSLETLVKRIVKFQATLTPSYCTINLCKEWFIVFQKENEALVRFAFYSS